jgi:hypothetical protein
MDAGSAFSILGLHPDSGQSDIRRVYRRLAKQYHPDIGGNAEKFKRINAAYEFLSSLLKFPDDDDIFPDESFDSAADLYNECCETMKIIEIDNAEIQKIMHDVEMGFYDSAMDFRAREMLRRVRGECR